MTPELRKSLDQAVESLRGALGDNLYSCCLYGSAVRGNLIEGVSDLNLLIVLNESNSGAHEAISRAIGGQRMIDPFIVARRGLPRTMKAFAPKFASIRRHYQVLHGTDPLKAAETDPQLEKFLCEQALRNLRLRLVFSYVTRQRHKSSQETSAVFEVAWGNKPRSMGGVYDSFAIRNTTPIFVRLSEALLLNEISLPTEFAARIPILEREFGIDGAVLRELLALKSAPRRLTDEETKALHGKLFALLDTVLVWIEARWPG